MPVGVPKVLYYWDDELPLQWIDLYNLIFRRRLVFVMSELDQDLCNQIAGMMVYIHFEDKRKELEKKGVQVVDLFEQTTNPGVDGSNSKDSGNVNSTTASFQDLMDSSLISERTIWDFEADAQKDFYMDIYNSSLNVKRNPDGATPFLSGDGSTDYLESPFAGSLTSELPALSNDQRSGNFFSNAGFPSNFNKGNSSLPNLNNVISDTTLKQYSNLFNTWLPLLPFLAKYSGGRYFSDLNFSEDIIKEMKQQLHFGQQKGQFLSSGNNSQISPSLLQSILSEGTLSSSNNKNGIYTMLKNYIDQLQRSTNKNEVWNLMDRRSFKESLKRSNYRDLKDQQIRELSSYTHNMDELNMLQNIRQKRPETEDLLFSETQERMSEQRRVFVFINSTGGSVTSGITIYDALQFVKAGAVTVCLGMAFSASSMVLAGGNIGHRYVSEGAHVMIHQPEGGISGQASDVLLDAHEIMRVRRQAATIYTLSSKRAFSEVLKDLDRDYFMTPQEAIDYGLADEIVTRYNSECILNEFEKDWLAEDAKQIEGITKKLQKLQDDDKIGTSADPRT
nr:proteolytic subunit 2 of clp protease [Chaetopeltis orbicularis]